MHIKLPASLRGGIHGLEDAIITLSGPGIAISGIIAGVDLLTGGHAMSSLPWLTVSWAICLLLSLDFQVLALGARAHQVYLSQKSTGRKVFEILLALAIAAAISYVSIQMQSIVAKMNAGNLSIDQATAALGIDSNALIFERSILVLVLIFLSGWFRLEDARSVVQPVVVQVNWEERLEAMVQMTQYMFSHFGEQWQAELGRIAQMNESRMNQLNQHMDAQLGRLAQLNQDGLHQLRQQIAAQPDGLALASEQLNDLLNQLSQGQERRLEAVFSRCIEQVFVREERSSSTQRQFTNPRMRAIPASSAPTPASSSSTEASTGEPLPGEQLASSEGGQRVLNFLNQCQAVGAEPSLSQIELECQVSHNTAIAWRRQWREKQAAQMSGK